MLRMYRYIVMATAVSLAGSAFAGENDLKLASLFSDHMVLQRDMDLKVWGTSKPHDSVKVKFRDAEVETKAGTDGKWLVKVPPQTAGGPYELTVSNSDETTMVKDVLVGEVWLCSGQSNMEFALNRAENAAEAIKNSANSRLRLFNVARNKALKPLDEFSPLPKWEVSSPETTPGFSAVGYFFGQELQKELNVPVGLIESSWGGTKAEWWTPIEGLRAVPYYQAAAREMENPVSDEKLAADYKAAISGFQKEIKSQDPGMKKDKALWAASEFDDSSWKETPVPAAGKLPKFDGSVWYRHTFSATADQAKSNATFTLQVDDDDYTYINGQFVGSTTGVEKQRKYKVPAGLLKEGINTVALQVWDWGKTGGPIGKPEDMKITFENSNVDINLAGNWKCHKGVSITDRKDWPVAPMPIRPTVLYNAMISPMINYAIRGATWYQGEGNASQATAAIYDDLLASMIKQWRKKWNEGDFPFYIVQLASYMKIEPRPTESDWAVLRESQANVVKNVPNTGLASAIDIGEENDIHPRNKEDVGKRLALNALAKTYNMAVEFSGPEYKSHTVTGSQIRIIFDHAEGLHTTGSQPLKGFAISGKDKKFVWADGVIDGNSVVLTAAKVSNPVYVRYGWANYSVGNLYNKADLPANPFRTDKSNN